jgi:hypothetical protein
VRPARAAVGEDLHRPDAQHVVPGAGHEAGAMAIRHDALRPRIAEQAHIGAHRQPSAALGRKVRADLAEMAVHPDRRIHAARNAERIEVLPGALDAADEVFIARRGQNLADRIAAVFGEHAGQLPVLHLDQPAGRRYRRGRDAGKLERLAVADRDVAAGAHQMHRIVGATGRAPRATDGASRRA